MDSFIVKAFTDNDYTDQDVEYFCIERSPEIITRYEKYVEIAKDAAEKVKDCPSLLHVVFWDGFDVFSGSLEELLGEGKQQRFLDVTEEISEQHESADACVNAHMIKVDEGGSLYWTAQGKHCGTHFWTGGIPFEVFKKGCLPPGLDI